MNMMFIETEPVVHTDPSEAPVPSPARTAERDTPPEPFVDQEALLDLQRRGLVTATFRRLDPDRQHAVLLAALEEMSTSGPAGFRVKEAAHAAGVSVGSLYQYFGSRQGLVDLAVTVLGERLAAELRGYVPLLAALPLADGLAAWVQDGIEWSRERSAMMRAFARAAYEGASHQGASPEGTTPEDAAHQGAGDPVQAATSVEVLVGPVADAMLDAVRAMLAAGRERGEVRADLDLEATSRAVHAMLCAVSDAHLLPHLGRYYQPSAPDVAFERTLAATVALVVAGVRP
jgi:AcrR family transcriptional regulator